MPFPRLRSPYLSLMACGVCLTLRLCPFQPSLVHSFYDVVRGESYSPLATQHLSRFSAIESAFLRMNWPFLTNRDILCAPPQCPRRVRPQQLLLGVQLANGRSQSGASRIFQECSVLGKPPWAAGRRVGLFESRIIIRGSVTQPLFARRPESVERLVSRRQSCSSNRFASASRPIRWEPPQQQSINRCL
ncbi:hypothetical protein BGZ60DRAFT_222857 [Tricladium varicosporioides]|nr:hypothetical protein BGZ60DRAFT_222857 [Hymenoscyphus varicosporioides]